MPKIRFSSLPRPVWEHLLARVSEREISLEDLRRLQEWVMAGPQAPDGDRGSPAKGNVAPQNVDEYLAGVPEPARSTLNRVRAAIRSAVPPEATEAISYRMPMFKYKGLLVGFAAFSNHCSLFPGSSVIEGFKNELEGFQTSKGTIRFPVDMPLPAALVKKLVNARVAENDGQRKR